MYKKISSKKIFEHPRLVVEEDDVELESGKTIKYLRYGYGGDGVVIVAKNEKQQILFIEEYSYVPNKKLLQLPMGKIENDEDIVVAANRELAEETGFSAEKVVCVGSYYQNHRRSVNMGYVMVTDGLSNANLVADDEEEGIKICWINIDEITKYIKAGEICDADTLSSLRLAGL